MAESKDDRFIRLAESRVNKALKSIRLVANLANRNNYSYTDEQVERVFAALQSELRSARKRFQDASVSSDDKFKL